MSSVSPNETMVAKITSTHYVVIVGVIIVIGYFVKKNMRPAHSLKGVNYAIVGNAGAGKSSLVNAIRRKDDSDEGAALVHAWKSSDLEHFQLDEGQLVWDIPESERTAFFKKYPFSSFSKLFVVGSGRFLEDDVKIANAALPHTIVTFVRTKLDLAATSLQNITPSLSPSEAYQSAYQTIHQDMKEQLADQQLEHCRVYVVSSRGIIDPAARYGDEVGLLSEFVTNAKINV